MDQEMPANQPNSTARTLTAVADSWEALALQEPWSEIIGTVREVGKGHIILLCSKEFMINCSRRTIRQYRRILRKGALVGILKTEGEDDNNNNDSSVSDRLRIRAISSSVASTRKEVF